MRQRVPEPAPNPMVSVILPIRNEADFVERCLRSVLANDYPPDRMEVLVVDGMSDDGTRDIVARLAAEEPRLRLLDNPRRITPDAMNRGIVESKGQVILRVDGHALVPPDFVRRSVQALAEHPEAWCAGGAIETVSPNFVGRAISAAQSSPVGVGNARFRLGHYKGYVDTVAFGAYWRWVFDRIGLFDPELVRNQDDEFNLRLILAGGKIYMDGDIRSLYYSRGSVTLLARQYFQYGFWRTRTIQKHRRPASLRQIVPLGFVLTWIGLAAAALIWHPAVWALVGFAAVYALGLLVGAVQVARRAGVAEAVAAPLIFMVLHFAYGIGTLKGVLWFLVLRRGGRLRLEDHPLSR